MQIISVIAGGPCHGILQAGDEILCVGDENVDGATLQDVSSMLAASPEDEIIFIIKRGKAHTPSYIDPQCTPSCRGICFCLY
jgi:hypothetical protein